MRVAMTNKRFPKHGPAKVPADDVETWEAAGWVRVPEPKPTKSKGEKK